MDIPFSVIILDDHRMMQEGLSSYLESHGCTVVARLASLSELEALLKNGVPVPEGTIAIVDKQLGTESGCDAVSMINASGRGIMSGAHTDISQKTPTERSCFRHWKPCPGETSMFRGICRKK